MNSTKISRQYIVFILITKYLIQGLVIAMLAFYLPTIYKITIRKPTINDVLIIGLIASLTMFTLDYFSNEFVLGLDKSV